MTRASEAGFTLVEAMVALVVLAVAAAGLTRATEAHIDTLRGLEARAAAQWVAENRLVELGLDPTTVSTGEPQVEMLGRTWRVAVAARPSPDRDLTQVDVSVAPAGSATPLVTLAGFIDTGAGGP